MDDDWDLQAVVRGCCNTSTSSATSTSSTVTTTTSGGSQLFSSFKPQQDVNFSSFQDLYEPRKQNFFEDLQDLYKPFFPQSTTISPLSVLEGLQDLPQQTQIQTKQSLVAVKSSTSHTPSPRSKRRKNHMKRVCHVPADSLSNDMWSWRKYGQKPIKGSPYPRGYYKCSTSKGCMARKQVERNRSDPGMFIVTYTAEHNHPMPTHRNSLAGSTRQKPAPLQVPKLMMLTNPLAQRQCRRWRVPRRRRRRWRAAGRTERTKLMGKMMNLESQKWNWMMISLLVWRNSPFRMPKICFPINYRRLCNFLGMPVMQQPPPPAVVDFPKSDPPNRNPLNDASLVSHFSFII